MSNGANLRQRRDGPVDAQREHVPSLALLANDPLTRGDLLTYLERAGYQVRVVERPESRERSLVWLPDELDERDHAAIAAVLLTWLVPTSRRAVLVTRRPTAYAQLGRAYPSRLSVLAAPVFAWQVVDALRGARATT